MYDSISQNFAKKKACYMNGRSKFIPPRVESKLDFRINSLSKHIQVVQGLTQISKQMMNPISLAFVVMTITTGDHKVRTDDQNPSITDE
jgi:hypothetical protein